MILTAQSGRGIHRVGKKFPIAAILAMVTLTAACDHITEPGEVEPELMALKPAMAVIEEGDFFELEPVDEARGDQAVAKSLGMIWRSSAPGVAVVRDGMIEGRASGEATITATTPGGKSATARVLVVRSPFAAEIVGGGTWGGSVGEPAGDEVVVRVVTRNGLPVPDLQVRFEARPGSGSASPRAVRTDANGVARTNWTLGTLAGTQRVDVRVPGRPGVLGTLSAEVQPGAPHEVVVIPSQLSFDRGGSHQLQAVVRDVHGNEVGAVPVRWISSNPEVADVDQEGKVTGLSTGSVVIEAIEEEAAASGALASGAAQQPGQRRGQSTVVIVDEGSSTGSVTITGGDGQTGSVGEALPRAVTVQVLAANGSPLRQTDVQWVVTSGGGSVSSAVTRTNGQGRAEVEWTMGAVPGANTLEARAAGVDKAVFGATALAGPVDRVEVSPGRAELDVGGSATLMARAFDGHGNEVDPSGAVDWTTLDPRIASVSDAGQVSALVAGETQVRASLDGVSGEAAVTVNGENGGSGGSGGGGGSGGTEGTTQPVIASVEVSPREAVIQGVGETFQFSAVARDSDGGEVGGTALEWISLSPSIASVDNEGTVVSKALGTVLIVAAAACCNVADTAIIEVRSLQEVANPDPVTDLAVMGAADRSVTLRFTEVSDGAGGPAQYQVRFAVHPIEWGWGQATPVREGSCGEPIRGVQPGQLLSCEVPGLEPGETYDFQLVAWRTESDGSRTHSPLSNVATGTTTSGGTGVARVAGSESSVAFTALGQDATVSAVAYDADDGVLSGASLAWTSSDEGVAEVTSTGRIIARGVGTALVVVSATCCEAAAPDTIEVSVTQELASVSVEPGSVNLSPGTTRELKAVARDANGHPMTGSGFAWSSSNPQIASVSSSGVVTAQSDGQATILASKDGVTGQGSVVVGYSGNSEFPNLPFGFTRIAETDFSAPSLDGFHVHGSMSLTTDPTAPFTCCDVGQKIFPVGSVGGGGIALSRSISSAGAEEIYLAVWMKVSDNFRNHSSGITKVFYAFSAGKPKMILSARGPNLELSSLLRYAPGNTPYLSPNVGDRTNAQLQRGEWHLVEYVIRSSSSPGVPDGSKQWWLDGVLVGDYSGLDTHHAGESLSWDSVQWNTIWGGVGDEVTEEDGDMFWWASHFYAAGRKR